MMKHTEKAALGSGHVTSGSETIRSGSEPIRPGSLIRRIPPARAMPYMATRPRTPGWISAKAVGSFVPGLTKKAFEKYGFSTASLITDWEKIAGSKFAAFTAPQRLKWPRLPGSRDDAADTSKGGRPGATLVLKTDPARALDAEYGAAQLIDRINAYFGYRAVAEIRLIQAPLDDVPAAGRPSPRALAAQGVRSAAIPPAIEAIPDKALGAALARFHAGMSARARQD